MSFLTVPTDGIATVFHATDSRVTRSHLCGTDGSGIRWRFCDGATLTLERRFAMPGLVVQPPRVPGFAFRIYCMAPSGEQLHFTFSAADGRSLRLTLRLNFHGWKEFCIPYERGFMLGHTAPDALCRLCIQAETGGGFSNILFRDIRLWAAVDALFVYPSLCAQVRHLACHPRRFPQKYMRTTRHAAMLRFSLFPNMSQKTNFPLLRKSHGVTKHSAIHWTHLRIPSPRRMHWNGPRLFSVP